MHIITNRSYCEMYRNPTQYSIYKLYTHQVKPFNTLITYDKHVLVFIKPLPLSSHVVYMDYLTIHSCTIKYFKAVISYQCHSAGQMTCICPFLLWVSKMGRNYRSKYSTQLQTKRIL